MKALAMGRVARINQVCPIQSQGFLGKGGRRVRVIKVMRCWKQRSVCCRA